MNPEIKAKWVAALRSGEYKQAKDYLRTNKGFCCLGVLCDLYAKEMPGTWSEAKFDEWEGTYFCTFTVGDDAALTGLPSAVSAWAGLGYEIPIRIHGTSSDITNHNDGIVGRSATFAQIADAIEAQL